MPEALSRKPEDMPQNETDDRLRARRRPLIDPARFHPSMYEDCARLRLPEDLQLYALDTTKHIDDLITESYEKSAFLTDLCAALDDPDVRQWPKGLQHLTYPFQRMHKHTGQVLLQRPSYHRPRRPRLATPAHLPHPRVDADRPPRPPQNHGLDEPPILVARTRHGRPRILPRVPPMRQNEALSIQTVRLSQATPPAPQPMEGYLRRYITPLPPCHRRGRTYRHVAVVVDRLTK